MRSTIAQLTRSRGDQDSDSFDQLLTERQAAALLSVTPRALQKWRSNGRGPEFIRISSRCIRYRRIDLAAWTADRVRRSTSDVRAR